MKYREFIFSVIEESPSYHRWGRAFDISMMVLIALNILEIVLESFRELRQAYAPWFTAFEGFSVAVFTIEYLLRLLTADLRYPGKSKGRALLSFVCSPLALIDLLAVLPFYLPLLLPLDMRFVRAVRLLRLARLFKLNRYSRSMRLIGEVIREKKSDLYTTVFVTFVLLIVASTLMYHLEGHVQPDAFPNILASFWWAVATLTTVGYGDVYPVTGLGKLISGVIALMGIGLVALPTGILSAAFIEKMGKPKPAAQMPAAGATCPCCGQKVLGRADVQETSAQEEVIG